MYLCRFIKKFKYKTNTIFKHHTIPKDGLYLTTMVIVMTTYY